MAANTVVNFILKGDSKDVIASLGAIDKTAAGTYQKIDGLRTAIAVGTVAAIGGVAKAVVNLGREYEEKISSIKALTGATDDQLKNLEGTIKELGAASAFSAGEVADATQEFLKAGVSQEQLLNGALKDGLDLAIAGNLDLADAAQVASTVLNTFSNDALSVGEAGNILAGAANSSATDIAGLQLGMSMAGTVASGLGVSFKDTATALAVFAQNGLKGSDAGTSLKTMLLNLQPQTKKQTQLFKELGLMSKSGANAFFDSKGQMKSLAEMSETLKNSMKGLTDQQKSLALEQMFGTDAIRAANILVKEGADGFDLMATNIGKVKMADVAAEKMNNLNGVLEEISGAFETIAINIYDSVKPALTAVAKAIQIVVQAFASLPQGIQSATVGIIAFVGALKAVKQIKGTLDIVSVAMKKLVVENADLATKGKIGFSGMASGLKSLITPAGLAVIAVSAIGIALFDAYQKNEAFKKQNTDVAKAIVGGFEQGKIAVGSYQQSLIDSKTSINENIDKLDEMSNMLALPLDSSNLTEYANTAKEAAKEVTKELSNIKENQLKQLTKSFSESSVLSKDREKEILNDVIKYGDERMAEAEKIETKIGDLTTRIASEKDLEKRNVLIQQYREQLIMLEEIKNQFASEQATGELEATAKEMSLGGVTDEERTAFLEKEKEFYSKRQEARVNAYANEMTLNKQLLEQKSINQDEYNARVKEADQVMYNGQLEDAKAAIQSRETLHKISMDGFQAMVDSNGKALTAGLSVQQQDVLNMINTLPEGMRQAAAESAGIEWKLMPETELLSSEAKYGGEAVGSGIASGINSKKPEVEQAASDVAKAANKELENGKNDAKTSGSYYGQGFANGISSMLGKVSNAAAEIANSALSMLNKTGVVRSPSRKTTQTGIYYGQGLAVGILSTIKQVQEASKKVGMAAIQAMNVKGINKVISNIEFEQKESQLNVNALIKARDKQMSTAVSEYQKQQIAEYYDNLIKEEIKSRDEAIAQMQQDNALKAGQEKLDKDLEAYKKNLDKKEKKEIDKLNKELSKAKKQSTKDKIQKQIDKVKEYYDAKYEKAKRDSEMNKQLLQQQYDLVEAEEDAIKMAEEMYNKFQDTNKTPTIATFGNGITSNTSNIGDVVLNFGDVKDPNEVAKKVKEVIDNLMLGVKDAPAYR